MKTQTGYKVVYSSNSKRLSAFTGSNGRESSIAGIDSRKIILEYKPNETTTPLIEGTKLFAFLQKEDAIKYAKFMGIPLTGVWECELSNPVINGWFHGIVGSDSPNEDSGIKTFEQYLAWFKNPHLHEHSEKYPSSCVCDSIKLLKQIE